MPIVRVRSDEIDVDKLLAELAARPEPTEEQIERWAEEDGGALTDEELARMNAVYPAPKADEIRTVREKLGLSQTQFARRFGFTIEEIEQYEAGTRRPSGPATSLLRVIQIDPDIVIRALNPQPKLEPAS